VSSEAVNQATRREWRELGFFYDRDDDSKSWRIVGEADGLRAFAKIVSKYAANPKNEMLSEHEHFGPYMYLEVGTWSEPQITDHWIAGPLLNLASLASFIEDTSRTIKIGKSVSLRSVFSPESPYDLVLELRDKDFDPALEDKQCW
jgi:hypothetical protein